MYLVDTSVWVDFIQGRETEAVHFLDSLIDNPLAFGLNDYIYMEILQGAKTQQGFDRLKKYFSGQKFYGFTENHNSYEQAALLYMRCRQKGVTVRSAVDCLITQCAVENDLVLLHHDRDYIHIQLVLPSLKQKHFLS
jgi:predicted nucleic acid-binding protein